jgi:glycosyltransferase involved in cell wall biosynthesis
MNRRQHLAEALPKTLSSIRGLSAEVCILDWSSTDGLVEVKDPQIKWKRIPGHKFYYPSKCKNEAHKLGTGEYLVNLDADNWVSKEWLEKILPELSPTTVHWSGNSGCWGRIVIHRDLFRKLNGYDEGMTGYGWQDSDLVNRARLLGATVIETGNVDFILHGDELRRRPGHSGFRATGRKNRARSEVRIAAGKFNWRTP